MFKHKIQISYFEFSLFFIALLSLTTLFVTIFSQEVTKRLLYLFFYLIFVNLFFLFGIAYLSNKRAHLKLTKTRIAFISSTVIYAFFYITSSLNFFFTTQSTRLQTILFVYKTNPFFINILILTGIVFFISLIVFFINKKFEFLPINQKYLKMMKTIIFISILILIISTAFFSSLLRIQNPIVRGYDLDKSLIIYPEKIESEIIFSNRSYLEKPNVLFILLESVSQDKISYFGYYNDTTPNIDKIANQSIVFENAYTTAVHSDYAQPTYLSSKYLLNNNYRNFFNDELNKTFVWDIFKNLDYYTFYFSSQNDLWVGMNKYFNYSSLDIYSYSESDNKTDYGGGLAKKDFDNETVNKAIFKLNETYSNCEKNNILNHENCSKPFFMYLNFQATHQPYSYPEDYNYSPKQNNYSNLLSDSDRETMILYDTSLRYVDEQVGLILNYLNNTQKLNNTVVIISADHGHDLVGKHGVYDHGLSLYEDEIKIPLLFYFPDISHEVIKERVSHIDVLPTFLDILRINQSENFRGTPMVKENRLFFYAQSHLYLIGMIKKDIKVIIDLNRNQVEIYNITKDPDEKENLLDKNIYNKEILELLTWHRCQLEYFSKIKKPIDLKEICEAFL